MLHSTPLVFFEVNLGHLRITVGNGNLIHAGHTGNRQVSLSDCWRTRRRL
jgi:hypothetical protein